MITLLLNKPRFEGGTDMGDCIPQAIGYVSQ